MRSICLAILGATLFLVPLFGEAALPGDAAVIDVILSQKAISWGNASWLIGRAVETVGEGASPADAAAKAALAGWGPAGLPPEAPIDLKAYSLMLVKALSISTGMMYRWFPGPRYALRELVFRKIVPATLAPDSRVSGAEAMRYLQAAQDWMEARK